MESPRDLLNGFDQNLILDSGSKAEVISDGDDTCLGTGTRYFLLCFSKDWPLPALEICETLDQRNDFRVSGRRNFSSKAFKR